MSSWRSRSMKTSRCFRLSTSNLAGWGAVDQWSEMRLLSAFQRLTAAQKRQIAQLDKLAVPFKAIEELQHKPGRKNRNSGMAGKSA
ncbi:MAG: hypothetical protein MZW92_49345 [Comamonadaceae bacterium]|nr:hypothetical protein [Comamonadaceae bacterium]